MKDLTKMDVPDDSLVCDLFMANVARACVTVADETGLFNHLDARPRTLEELSTVMNSNTFSLGAVTRVLVANQFLVQSDTLIQLSPQAKAYFVRSSPLYRGFQFSNSEDFWHQKILVTLKEGWRPIGADGKSFTAMWEEGTLSQAAADRFTAMMHTNISGPAIAAARSGAFENVKHLVDVGGGSGILLAAVKQHLPQINVTLMELPQVCESAKAILKSYVDTNSIGFYPANMFVDGWPDFADAFLLSNVLHDWPKEKAMVILRRAFSALKPGSSLFIYECLLNEDRVSPKHTAAFDLLMAANHQSQQFTRTELATMLTECGFQFPELVFSFGYYSLLKTVVPHNGH